MLKLPNAENAVIETEKLSEYILSSTHPVGRFKATVFRKLGYSASNWREFERNLRELILTNNALEVEASQYGRKFIVEGSLSGLTGDPMQIVTIWFILKGEDIPRFVTAYPGG